jgi:hypothetical protein
MGKIQSNDMERVIITPLSLCERHHLLCFLLVNLACKCRNVVSNIRFPYNIEIILCKLWVLLEENLKLQFRPINYHTRIFDFKNVYN